MEKRRPIEVTAVPPLAPRPANAHKGSCGRVLVIAGSKGMAGAAAFAGLSAYRMGAGLVKLCSPEENRQILQMLLPEAVWIPLTEEAVEAALPTADALLLGPGLGQSDAAAKIADFALARCHVPLLLDADGLNLLAAGKIALPKGIPAVLTPHPGELARLCGCTVAQILEQPENRLSETARALHCICLLKLPRTLTSDGETLWRNHSGCPALATGGSGDCLSGMIAALLADGMPAADAAVTGVFLHGKCGELAAAKLGERPVLARDLPSALPEVLQMLWKEKEQNDGAAR